jgi:hypothetical protein
VLLSLGLGSVCFPKAQFNTHFIVSLLLLLLLNFNMAPKMNLASAAAVLALSSSVVGQTYLSPEQDIVLPDSSSAANPLVWLGANSPWYAGSISFFY